MSLGLPCKVAHNVQFILQGSIVAKSALTSLESKLLQNDDCTLLRRVLVSLASQPTRELLIPRGHVKARARTDQVWSVLPREKVPLTRRRK